MANQTVTPTVKIAKKDTPPSHRDDPRMALVAEIGEVVNAGYELDITLNRIMDRLRAVVGYTAAEISLWHPGKQAMVVCAQAGDPRYTRQAKGIYTPQEGYTGWLARHGQPLLIEDALRHPDIRPKVADHDRPIRSFLGIPLRAGDQRFGTIELVSDTPHAFSPADIPLLTVVGQYAVTAIKNAQLLRTEQLRADYLSAIHQVATAANSTLDSSEIFRRSLVTILTVINLDQGGVTLFDHEGGYGYPLIAHPPYPAFKGPASPVPLGDNPLITWLLEHKQPLAIEDALHDARLAPLKKAVKSWEVKSLLLVPLMVKDSVIGTIDLYAIRGRRRFSASELALVKTMANQVSTAINNAQLYQSEQQYVQALEAIQANSVAVSAILELKELLPFITQKAVEIFNAPAAGLMLWDDRQEHLVIRAASGLSSQYTRTQYLTRDQANSLVNRGGAKPRVVNLHRHPLGVPELIEQEGMRHALVAPLTIGSRLTGVLNIYTKDNTPRFNQKHEKLVAILANQTAIAIENARRYQSEQHRVQELSGLNRISQAISALTDIHQVYQLINMSIAELANAEMCATLLYSETKEALVCQLPAYGVPDELARQYSIPLSKDSLVYALWKMRSHFILNGVPESSLMVEMGLSDLTEQAHVRDTLFIKLTVGNRDIGALQASNKRDGAGFNEDDARLLSIFAGQAAAVIENARLYEELKRAMGLVSARTGLAWMGMANSAWRHAVDKHALTIREQTRLLRRKLNKLLPAGQLARLEERLDMIERLSGKILEKPLTLPLSAEAGIESVAVNELVGERARQLWQNDPYKNNRLRLNLALPATATVRASPEWLRRAFDILVDNAVNALSGRDIREIEIGSRSAGRLAEIYVSDTGPGLPPHILQKIGVEFIEKPEDAKGLGMGLLMAQTIVQTYGGEIRVGATGPTGTTMIIGLPLEYKPRGDDQKL